MLEYFEINQQHFLAESTAMLLGMTPPEDKSFLFFCCITVLSGNVSIVYIYFFLAQKICQGKSTIDNLFEAGSESTVSRQVGAVSWERIILNCQPPHCGTLLIFQFLFFFFLTLGGIFYFNCQRWVVLRIVRDVHPAVKGKDKGDIAAYLAPLLMWPLTLNWYQICVALISRLKCVSSCPQLCDRTWGLCALQHLLVYDSFIKHITKTSLVNIIPMI